VITSDDGLREFRDPFAFATWDAYTASAVLMPETVEEIQQIVRIANEHKVPPWTHGTGVNNGYGGPAPRLKGSVIVSLRRMNRILEINVRTPSPSRASVGSTCMTRCAPAGTG
jgi:4-cresol dehydrogenase (hydroxylating) flavoprotein subunit